MQALLDSGASVDVRDGKRRTPLHGAAKGGSERVVNVLLEAGADAASCDWDEVTPLHLAARGGSCGAVKAILDAGADLEARSNKGSTPLHWAASRDNESAVKTLIGSGADVKQAGRQRRNGSPPCGCRRLSRSREGPIVRRSQLRTLVTGAVARHSMKLRNTGHRLL